jgi:hypothetical protein
MTRRTLLVVVVLLVSTSLLHSQDATDPSGHWEGAIQTPEISIAIEVDLARNSGQLAGTISVPPQNLRGLPLVIEPSEGRSVSFRFRGARGNRHFQGTLSDDGTTIAGDFIQSGHAMPFSLKRTGEARIEPLVKSPPIGKELEGPWSATLDGTYANGIQRRLILTLSNQPDGTSTGTVVTPGDGLEIPIASITQDASTVTLDLRAVSGSYSGTVNADGTELKGTFIQGTAVLPLTFRRTATVEKPE